MIKQLHDWKVLVDTMIEKVWEYIDEVDYWNEGAKIWVDAPNLSVVLAEEDEVRPGEGTPVDRFIKKNARGKEEPNGDRIEEYAYQKFDFRVVD